jgi:molybdopterin/thiamine biosynthesis adenylyltransferase/rhodanese-related sulfurtransferase
MTVFSPEEQARYTRHWVLPGWGQEKQALLKQTSVLVVGAGGLGAPLLTYLAAAGLGRLGIVDPDRVSLSNLQRQVLYGQEDLGRLKVEAARDRLNSINPHVLIEIFPLALTAANALSIMKGYDIIADGTDNFPTRYLVNDACVLLNKVNVYAAIFRFEGQLSVFNFPHSDGSRGPNYRDLYPQPPAPGTTLSCAEGGVLGVLPGIIGSLQATEVIKVATSLGQPLVGQLFYFDALSFSSHRIRFQSRPGTRVERLTDYEAFCGTTAHEEMPAIDPASLRQLLLHKEDVQLIDIRTLQEHSQMNIGGELIPLPQLPDYLHRLDSSRLTIVYCQTGRRSELAVRQLLAAGFEDVYQLEGGVQAWVANGFFSDPQPES